MRLILFFIATSLSAQVTGSLHEVLPNRANADTGSVRLWNDTQTFKIDVRAVADQITNKVFRIPSENATAVATENHRYGTDSFTITGIKAGGTESSPSDVTSGAVLFQFMGMARSGGAEVNAGSITFGVDASSPLDTSINFGLAVGGSYGTRFGMDKDRFYGVGRPDLGMSAAGGRWGTIYGDSADFLVPTGSSPQYETGSFIRAQSLELYDSAGYSGGFKFQVTNTPAGNSKMELLDASANPVMRFTRVDLSGSPVTEIDSYMSIIPATGATYNLGSLSKPWSFVYGNTIQPTATLVLPTGTGYGVDSDALPTADATYDLGASGRRWNKLWVGDIDVSGTCTGCSGGSGSAPLNEVKITDYGADNTCTTAITAGSPSPWEQAYDVAKLTGGYITLPAGGCYGIDDTLANGNSAGTSESTDLAITIKGAGAAYNPSGLAPATEIRWIGSAPGSPTPMVEFRGPINAGGIEGVLLNANNTANVYYVRQRHHGYGTFRNVWAKRSPVSPSWIVTTSSNTYPYGSCYNRYDQLHITNDSVSGGGGMYLTGATGSGRDACSNLFTDGEIWYDSDTAGTYGVKLDYADNNTFLRFNLFRTSNGPHGLESSYSSGSAWAVSANTSTDQFTLGAANSAIVNGARVRFSYTGSLPTGIQWALPYFVINKSGNSFQVSLTSGGSAVDMTTTGSNVIVFLVNPGVLLERYSSDTSFPKENAWYSSAIHNGVWSPNPPTGGNDFPEFQPDDCYVSPCIPDLDYVWGKAKGQMLGSGATPPGVEVRHSDSQNTFRINQASGLYNGAGSIAFQRNSTTLGRIRAHYSDGLVFSTSSGGGAATERWRISDSGQWLPSASATYSVGSNTALINQLWATEIKALTTSALQSHDLYGGVNVNLNLSAYGGSGNDNRAFLNFYRYGGTPSSPSNISSADRLGGIAWWGNIGGAAVGARIQVYADVVSGGSAMATSMRFHTANLGSDTLRWYISNSGHWAPGANLTYDLGEIGNSVRALYVNDIYSGSITPQASAVYSVGSSGNPFNGAEFSNGSVNVRLTAGSNRRVQLSGGVLQTFDGSGNQTFAVTTATGAITVNGSTGYNGSFTCPVPGTHLYSITLAYGIFVSGSCN